LETDKVLESPGIFFSRLEIIEELLPAPGLLPKCLFSPISIKIMYNNCPKVVSMSFFFLSLSLRIKVR
jgi:hypothetical protein